ncbi:MAG TPA: GNAT family N-acetyltransferase [Cyclobacteriaceae bacterium]|nr:GNAT family N-acetyltransferase [Cyclobacteriaceae bacterium]
MFVDVHCPDHLTPGELDAYLDHGWFRMGQTIFTTNWLNFKETFYSAIWLRVRLDDYAPGGTEKKLIQKNAAFRTEIRPASITIEKELLYLRYKQAVPFEASASLQTLLFGNSDNNIFDTHEVNVYHDDKLVAAGYFDMGSESAMGISSIYDPDYKKYSLGKFLIYQKIRYCRERGMKHFYPGYFVPGYRAFDYKRDIGTSYIEFLELRSGSWQPLAEFTSDKVPLSAMVNRLTELKKWLASAGVQSEVLYYDYFYANQTPELSGTELLDFPVFLTTQKAMGDWSIVVFDVRTERYLLLKCYPVLTPPSPAMAPGYYSEYVLKAEETLFISQYVDEIGSVFSSTLKTA